MSLPTTAEVLVNWVPVNCMPSPESPAKRMVTVSSSSRCFSTVFEGWFDDSAHVVFAFLAFSPFLLPNSHSKAELNCNSKAVRVKSGKESQSSYCRCPTNFRKV